MSFLFKVFVALHTNDKWAALDDCYIFAAMNPLYYGLHSFLQTYDSL